MADITLRVDGSRATISLTRPAVRNAFNDEMIALFASHLDEVAANDDVRVLVVDGEGPSFCAGADLAWMRSMKDYSFDENVADARRLADLLEKLFRLPLPTVGRIHGDAVGGGTGLVAALDVAVAAETARFAFTEVRLGMAPAVISPYLIYRMGPQHCRRLFLTGERFTAPDALRFGLVDLVVTPAALDDTVSRVVDELVAGGPHAGRRCKELAQTVPTLAGAALTDYTTTCIAELRVAAEGQERMAAFLTKMATKG